MARDDSHLAFTTRRNYPQPRERVFAAWANVAELERWWAPKGTTLLAATGIVRAGGMFLYGLALDGEEHWMRLAYRDVFPPMEITYLASYADRRGTPIRHPRNPSWPLHVLTRVNFDKAGSGTAIIFRAVPEAATDVEKSAFESARFDMKDAMESNFERLDHYLAG